MIILTTSTPMVCGRCVAAGQTTTVPPRGRRILDDPHRPICPTHLAEAGLTELDQLLAAAVAVENRLEAAVAGRQRITPNELTGLVGAVLDAAIVLARDQLEP